MTEAEHQELIQDTPEDLRPVLSMLHLFEVRNLSRSTIRKITAKNKKVESLDERIRMAQEQVSWLEDPEVTEEEFLRRLENQK